MTLNQIIKKTATFSGEKKIMTKAEIVEMVHLSSNLSKSDAVDLTELVFETIKQSLERGEYVKLPGFGNFSVREKNAHVGRNPKTGEKMEISARKVLSFKPSQKLRERVRG
jgi:integration host factor subunit alpha